MNAMKQWVAEHRRVSAASAGLMLILMLVTLSNIFAGLPDPRQPAPDLFDNPDPALWALRAESARELTVFGDRPLFSATRRIKVRPPAEESAPKSEPVGPVLTLDKWSLLGIFDSGEVEGALIRHPDSGRHRLVLGESVDGWELISVDPRSVRFKSVAGGSQAELNMALATVNVLPVPAADSGTAETAAAAAAVEPQADKAAASESGEAPAAPPTVSFRDYYRVQSSEQN